LSPIRVLVSAIATILLIRRVLEPTSLVIALISSWLLLLPSPRSEDVLDNLSRLDTLNSLFFCGFVSIGDGGPKDVFYNAPWEAFYEELDGFGIGKMIPGDSRKAFEVIRVLIDLGPL